MANLSHDEFWALVNAGVTVLCLIAIGTTCWWVNR